MTLERYYKALKRAVPCQAPGPQDVIFKSRDKQAGLRIPPPPLTGRGALKKPMCRPPPPPANLSLPLSVIISKAEKNTESSIFLVRSSKSCIHVSGCCSIFKDNRHNPENSPGHRGQLRPESEPTYRAAAPSATMQCWDCGTHAPSELGPLVERACPLVANSTPVYEWPTVQQGTVACPRMSLIKAEETQYSFAAELRPTLESAWL